jgi:hypothetical protein
VSRRALTLASLVLSAFLISLDVTIVNVGSIGAALAVAAHLHAGGNAQLGAAVHHVAEHAFTHGLSVGCLVAAGVSAVGAVLAGILLPAHPQRTHDHIAEPLPVLQAVAAAD